WGFQSSDSVPATDSASNVNAPVTDNASRSGLQSQTSARSGQSVKTQQPPQSQSLGDGSQQELGASKATSTKDGSEHHHLEPTEDEGATPVTEPEGGYPEQLHAGRLSGVGPEYGKQNHVGISERMKGVKEEIEGTVTRNSDLKQLGKERRTGELKKKQKEEDVRPSGQPTGAGDDLAKSQSADQGGEHFGQKTTTDDEAGTNAAPQVHPTEKGREEQAASVRPEGSQPTQDERARSNAVNVSSIARFRFCIVESRLSKDKPPRFPANPLQRVRHDVSDMFLVKPEFYNINIWLSCTVDVFLHQLERGLEDQEKRHTTRKGKEILKLAGDAAPDFGRVRIGRFNGNDDSPCDVSRGMYAGEVGVPRLLKLMKKYDIKATWFIPGEKRYRARGLSDGGLFYRWLGPAFTDHCLETFPEQMAAVRDAGHELHVSILPRFNIYNGTDDMRMGLEDCTAIRMSLLKMSVEQQKDILDYTFDLITAFNNGIPPKGSVAPSWETSKECTNMLLDKGIEYDHSSMAHDSQAYYLRDEDYWTNIDYKAKAHAWMEPLRRGKDTGLVQIPANWYLDDYPPLIFVKSKANSHGWVNTRDVEDLWKDTFSYCYREEEDFIFPITIHPDVSGRPHVLLMLERFIEWVNTHEHVQWVPMIEMARAFRAKQQPVAGARMPAGFVS
ncbi:hypothetical protein EW145_g7273, partial [Phellinidium pouzarii]